MSFEEWLRSVQHLVQQNQAITAGNLGFLSFAPVAEPAVARVVATHSHNFPPYSREQTHPGAGPKCTAAPVRDHRRLPSNVVEPNHLAQYT